MAYIDATQIKKWKNLKRDVRTSFYTEHFLVPVADRLRERVREERELGIFPPCRNLVTVMGHDLNPLLIMVLALGPEVLTVLHTSKHRTNIGIMNEFFRKPGTSFSGKVELVELDHISSDRNGRVIRRLIRDNTSGYRHVLCDVTAGKNIIAAETGIAAYRYRCETAYLDGEEHHNGVPVPGTEIIYLGNREIMARPRDHLDITYRGGQEKKISFRLLTESASRQAQDRVIDGDIAGSLISRLDEYSGLCSHGIVTGGKDLSADLDSLARLIQTNFLPTELRQYLQQHAPRDLNIIASEELAAVPWELCLSRSFGMELPLYRIVPRLPDDAGQGRPDENGKILLIMGSGEGIDDYNDRTGELQSCIVQLHGMSVREGTSRAGLRDMLSREAFEAVVYFGHAQWDKAPDKTGWVCTDGSVFNIKDMKEVFMEKPPRIIIASACQTARSSLFSDNAPAYGAIRAGCRTYIGANWLLEVEKSALFISTMLECMVRDGWSSRASFAAALKKLEARFGKDDIALYNYVYYGQ